MDLSIIILNYNTKDFLRRCLRSVFASTGNVSFEALVADNASSDGSVEMVRAEFPHVRVIENKRNVGFAKGNNAVIPHARGQYILLLNPDTEIAPDTLSVMCKFMNERSDIGVSGCKVVKPNGTLDLACRRSFPDPVVAFLRLAGFSKLFPKSKFFARYNLTYLPEDEVVEVDSVVGAFMMIRREVIEKIGLLDEEFFMYGEDLDYCKRTKDAGWKVYYYQKTTVTHHKGISSRKRPFWMIYEFHRAMHIFYKKHLALRYGVLVSAFVYLGIWLRYAVMTCVNVFRKERIVSR